MLNIGDSASYSKLITESDIINYAGLTGDTNSLHMDLEYAEKSPFRGRIVHGMFTAGLISTVFGTQLPGDGAVYLSQSITFIKPVYCGDTVTAICTVKEIINPEKGIYRFDTKCINQNAEVVVDGEAVIKYMGSTHSIEQKDNISKYCTFYSSDELSNLGLKKCGKNVSISRNAVLYNPELLEIGSNVRIDDFTTISGRVIIGDYIHIAQFCGIYGGTEGVYMDDFSGLSSKVVIYATSNDYSGESLTNPTVPAKFKSTDKNQRVHICKHVVIGTSSVILPGVTVGEGCSVGALSLCTKDLEPWGIYVGSPARRIKERKKKILELEKELRNEEKKNNK